MSKLDLTLGRLGRDTFVYGLAFAISRATSLVMLPIYTRYLTPEDYGTLHLVELTLEIAVLLLRASAMVGITRFYFKADDPGHRNRVVSSSFYLVEAFNLIAALGLLAAAPYLADALLDARDGALLLQIAAVNVSFEAFVLVPMTFMQLTQRARMYTVVSCVRLFVQTGGNVLLLVFLGWGVRGPLVATLATNALVGAALTAWMLSRTGIGVSWVDMVNLLRFDIPYRVARIGAFLLTFGDRYFLKAHFATSVIGIYSLGYQFGFLLILLTATPFMQAWNPQRFALVQASREVREASYNRGLVYFSLLVVAVGTAICVFVRPLLTIMSDPAFHGAIDLVPLLVLAYAVQAWTDVVELGIQVSERTKYAGYATWISVVVVLALYALLIPRYGAFGAAAATLIAFVVRFACYYAFSQFLWHVAYDWRPTALLLGYGTASVIAARLGQPAGVVGQIVAGVWIYLAFIGLVWFGGVLKRSERESILRLARQHLRHLRGPRAA